MYKEPNYPYFGEIFEYQFLKKFFELCFNTMIMKDTAATSLDFETIVIAKSHEKPILVDFWAPWCGPCRLLSPVLEQLAIAQQERWELIKVNTEEEQGLSERFEIMTIPTVKLFYQGKVVADMIGAYPQSVVERWLQQFMPVVSESKVV